MQLNISVTSSDRSIKVTQVNRISRVSRPSIGGIVWNTLPIFPVSHPTLADTKIDAVENGFQFVVEGVVIATITKDGITYG
jgi:hypothetical protein